MLSSLLKFSGGGLEQDNIVWFIGEATLSHCSLFHSSCLYVSTELSAVITLYINIYEV